MRDVFRAAGLTEAERAGWRQVRGEAVPDVVTVDGFHVEVKRCERVELPKWLRQAEAAAAAEGAVPVVAYRQSLQPWRAVMPLDALAALLVELHKLRAEVDSIGAAERSLLARMTSSDESATTTTPED